MESPWLGSLSPQEANLLGRVMAGSQGGMVKVFTGFSDQNSMNAENSLRKAGINFRTVTFPMRQFLMKDFFVSKKDEGKAFHIIDNEVNGNFADNEQYFKEEKML